MKQQELFQDQELQNEQGVRTRTPVFAGRYLRTKVAYEDLIFGGLSLVLVLLAVFCVGVERGKLLAGSEGGVPVHLASGQDRLPVVAARPPSPVVAAKPSIASPTPALLAARVQMASSVPPEVNEAVKNTNRHYAIQLASYVGARAAQREAKRLSAKGFHAEVLKQGRYFELRASGYPDRKQAAVDLSELKKWYHDAFIKKVAKR